MATAGTGSTNMDAASAAETLGAVAAVADTGTGNTASGAGGGGPGNRGIVQERRVTLSSLSAVTSVGAFGRSPSGTVTMAESGLRRPRPPPAIATAT
jgi:hypothetical protein